MKLISTPQWAIPQVKLMVTKNDKNGRRRSEDESWWPQLSLIEQICSSTNLNQALRRVKKNKGYAGVDL